MHAKSLVVDERVGVIGTTTSIRAGTHSTTKARWSSPTRCSRGVASSIRVDLLPANSWTIARRPDQPFFPGLEYTLAKISEKLPVFDLWPVRYATSYEFVPGPDCPEPLSPFDPRFAACYRSVGDFPEVALGFKPLLTRIFTAFGSGLAPIL